MKKIRICFRSSIAIILIVILFSVLLACTSNRDRNTVAMDGDKMAVNLDIPDKLYMAIVGSNLQAEVRLDGGNPIALFVDPTDNTISGRIDGVSAGKHRIEIIYYVVLNEKKTTLATVTKLDIDVSDGQSTGVSIASDELDRNYNDDDDGSTNLAEVLAGTDPWDTTSFPKAPSGFSVAQGSFLSTESLSTMYRLSAIVGQPANGTTTTNTNIKMTAGFTSY